MSNTSPAAERVMSVLNFFAEHPGQAFSLTNIARALKLNAATGHALLLSLTRGGYLYRNPDKTFVLGPTARALGSAAQQDDFSALDVARQEMRLLADRFGIVVAALFLEDGEIVARERAASAKHLGWAPPPGQRYPHGPSSGFTILFSPDLDEVALHFREPAEFYNRHGFIFAIGRRDDISLKDEGVPGLIRQERVFGAHLDPSQSYNVLVLSAPVKDKHGEAAFVLAAYGFDRNYTGAEIAEMGASLSQACVRVTSFITGKNPPRAATRASNA
jgi:DNA-binding IclR family transcriptional regulator